MNWSTAAQHLETIYQEIRIEEGLSEAIVLSLAAVRYQVIEHLKRSRTAVARGSQDINLYIERKRLKQADAEMNLRKHKLKQAKLLKQQLEGKLIEISRSIKRLSPEPQRTSPRLDLKNKEIRHQFYLEESERRRAATELTHKLRQARLEGLQGLQARQKEENLRSDEAFRRAEMQKAVDNQRRMEAKERLAAEIQSIIADRKAAMLAKRRLEAAEQHRINGLSYAQEKLLLDYHRRILLPIEEQRNAILAKNKALHRPIEREELREHTHKHDEIMKQMRTFRAEKTAKLQDIVPTQSSKFTQSLLKQAKQQSEERNSKEIRKRQMCEKRKRYAELVNTLFVPSISLRKQKELKETTEKLKPTAQTHRIRSLTPKPFRPRKFKPNPLVAAPRERRTPSPLDYLAEQRRIRLAYEADILPEDHPKVTVNWDRELNRDLTPSQLAQNVQEKAMKIERESQRKALLLSHVHPANPHALVLSEQLDSAMLQSIRAKLSVLDLA